MGLVKWWNKQGNGEMGLVKWWNKRGNGGKGLMKLSERYRLEGGSDSSGTIYPRTIIRGMKFCLDPCVESLGSPTAHVKASGATALSRCDLLLTCLFTYYRLVITHLRGGGYTYGLLLLGLALLLSSLTHLCSLCAHFMRHSLHRISHLIK